MDKHRYGKNRIDIITAMMMILAGLPEYKAAAYIRDTVVYRRIIREERSVLSEGCFSNLLDMVKELTAGDGKAPELEKVTPAAVCDLNLWMLLNGIENAGQLKAAIPKRDRIMSFQPESD